MDRRSFLRASSLAGLGTGASGALANGLLTDSKMMRSYPSDLEITDLRGCVLATHFPNPIIKIYTNQDIVGLGEVRDNGWLASALMMKPHLVGKNPLNPEEILRSIRHLSGHGRFGGGYSAIDIALLDLVGKALEVPSWKLLDMGERQREEVPMYAALGPIRDTPRFEKFMEQRLETGYEHYKFNARSLRGIEGALNSEGLPTQKGMEVWGKEVRELRDMLGYDVTLGAQAFGRQSVQSAIQLGQFMADSPYGLAYIEEMIPFQSYDAVNRNRQVTESSPTPTLTGENIFGFESFASFIEAGAFDMIHPDMLTAGGMLETKRIAEYAHKHGLRTAMHAAPSPVALIAMVHCASTIRSFHALEYQYRWPQMPWWGDLVSGIEKPIIQSGGKIRVPEGPGLGIEFNEEVAEKYLMAPQYLPFDPGLFDPTPEFDQPMRMLEAKNKGLIDYDRDGSYSWWHLDENLDYGLKPRGT